MNAEQGRQSRCFKKFSRGHVSGQHALLNKLVCIVSMNRHDGVNFPALVKNDAGFYRLKIDRATAASRPTQTNVELVQSGDVCIALCINILMPALLNHLANLGICQPRMGVNNRFIKMARGNHATFIDFHFTDHGQSIDPWLQGTQTIGQHLGKHGHHPLGKINRVAAILRLLIHS